MSNHNDCKRGFSWFDKAWYAGTARADEQPHITFGLYHPEGGTTGEMQMVWEDIGRQPLTPRLCVFDDAWTALASFDDLLRAMAETDGQCITQEQFVEMLLACGFEDMTEYARPEHRK